ncbi:lipopolysaccharide core heptose(II) kinase RfaY [Pseudocitrobacter faecalis]|uniref:lipopolysaccharide core heptose(II) kinase RfaY n=1 Tax=Pseudocitrobacter faecalis TaxID=1398493 RepID=UPI0016769F5D|nr:lipopolysaccharide core heptose(II) kinase RfaY [Pseudocitrobacter faecalis]GHD95732.1 lipopolysaccharide core heptose(II) kinase RfaY [Pseudocitrobacter faecalis]
MSIKHHINDYVVFTKSDGEKYIDVFNDFLSYNIKIIKVFRNIEDTKVLLIDTQYGKMILKIFAPKVKQNERFLKAMVKGDYYEKLFEQTERVRKEGLYSVNDFYLLAEKKTLRFAHYYIMLIEYIEGVELVDIPEIDDELKQKIKASISGLHQHGMVSGDPHKGNFIIENGVVRIIDLSGKSPSAMRMAKDRIDLERHYGIINEVKDAGYYRLIFKRNFRNFIRRLKGKKVR